MSRQANTLPYRGPAAGGDLTQRVMSELIKLESLSWAAAIGKLALGIPLCLLGPFLIAAVVKSIQLRAGGGVLPSFPVMWALATIVLVPLLMWLERRTRGEFYSESIRGESSPLEASSYGEYQ